MSKHYIKLDGNLIEDCYSSAFTKTIPSDAICICEDGTRQFVLPIDDNGETVYITCPSIKDARQLPRFKWNGKYASLITDSDMLNRVAEYEAGLPSPDSTQVEINLLLIAENKELKARVDILEGK